MKKALIFALAALPVLFACKKSGTEATNLETPQLAKEAAKVVIKNPISVTTKDNKTIELKEINFMRSGRYVAQGLITKANEPVIVLTGKWTSSNGKYSVTGDITATITITSNSIDVNGQSSAADISKSNIQAGSTQDKISRSWKLDHIILDFAKLGGKARYDSMAEIVTDIKAHKIELSAANEKLILDHEIVEISLDEGIICVTFKNADAFKGSWNISGTSFNYTIDNFEGALFNAQASGSVNFSGNNAVITMNLKTNIEQLGNGSAELTLTEVK